MTQKEYKQLFPDAPVLSMEIRARLSECITEAWEDLSYIERRATNHSNGDRSFMQTEEWKQKQSIAQKKLNKDPERRKFLSEIASRSSGNPQTLKGHYTLKKAEKPILYQSSYELRRLKQYECDPKVVYVSRGPRIPYNETRGYYPDFYFVTWDGVEHIEEIKNNYNVLQFESSDKHKAALQYCVAEGVLFHLSVMSP